MAKSKSKSFLKNLVMLIAGVLGVVSVFLMLLPGITTVSKIGSVESSTSGFELMFGVNEGSQFNFVMFLAFLLNVFAVIGVVLFFFLKNKSVGAVLAVLGFLASAILYFLFKTVFPMCFEDGENVVKAMELLFDIKLGLGAILSGVCSILAFLCAVSAGFVIKK